MAQPLEKPGWICFSRMKFFYRRCNYVSASGAAYHGSAPGPCPECLCCLHALCSPDWPVWWRVPTNNEGIWRQCQNSSAPDPGADSKKCPLGNGAQQADRGGESCQESSRPASGWQGRLWASATGWQVSWPRWQLTPPASSGRSWQASAMPRSAMRWT